MQVQRSVGSKDAVETDEHCRLLYFTFPENEFANINNNNRVHTVRSICQL